MIYNESQIDECAMQAISDIIGNVYEYSDDDKDTDNMRLITLGEVTGIVKLAESLKAAVKEEKEKCLKT